MEHPADLPKARSGVEYPLDVWEHNGRDARTKDGLLTYDSMLPPRLAWRLVYAHSNSGDPVVDPFTGASSIAEQAQLLDPRVIAATSTRSDHLQRRPTA